MFCQQQRKAEMKILASILARAVVNGLQSEPSPRSQADITPHAPGGFSITLALAGTITHPDGTVTAFSRVELRPVVGEVGQ